MEGSSGSVVLQQSHVSVNMEMAERQQQTAMQRLEMAENCVKRTRHPFSGYKEILFRDRTTPVHKLTYKGKKPYKMAMTEDEHDQVLFGGAQDEVRNLNVRAPEPEAQRQEDEPQAPRAMDEDELRDLNVAREFDMRFPGFQPPVIDPNTGNPKYTTLTAEGKDMFDRFLQFIDPPNARWVANHPDRVDIFYSYLERQLQERGPDFLGELLEMFKGRRQNPRQWPGPDDFDPNGNRR